MAWAASGTWGFEGSPPAHTWNPHPPVDAYFFASFTITVTNFLTPSTEAPSFTVNSRTSSAKMVPSGYGNGPPFFRVGSPFAFTWMMCIPSTWPKTGLSFPAVIEFTTNQSRNPLGKRAPSSADVAERVPNNVEMTARPTRTPVSLYNIDATPLCWLPIVWALAVWNTFL